MCCDVLPPAAPSVARLPPGSQRLVHYYPILSTTHPCLPRPPRLRGSCSLVITPAMPGAQPLADQSQTLEAAGVASCMLAVKFAD